MCILSSIPSIRLHPCASPDLWAGTETSVEAQELRGDIERSTATINEQQRLVATLLERALELRDILHRLVVYFLNYVATAQTGFRHLAGGIHAGNHNSRGAGWQTQLFGDFRVEIGDLHAIESLAGALFMGIQLGGFRGHFGKLDGEVALVAIAQGLQLHAGSWRHHGNASCAVDCCRRWACHSIRE